MATDFEAALEAYLKEVTEACRVEKARIAPSLAPDTFEVMHGSKYIRVVRVDPRTGTQEPSRSSHCFVDSNGNIYKCDSWKRSRKIVDRAADVLRRSLKVDCDFYI